VAFRTFNTHFRSDFLAKEYQLMKKESIEFERRCLLSSVQSLKGEQRSEESSICEQPLENNVYSAYYKKSFKGLFGE